MDSFPILDILSQYKIQKPECSFTIYLDYIYILYILITWSRVLLGKECLML